MRGPALSGTSTPTSAEVTTMIDDVEGEINSALASHGVTVPVTAPAAFLAWLGDISANGTAALAMTARFADPTGINADSGASRLEKRFRDAMARLWDGSAIPASLALDSAVLPTSYSVEYPDEEPDLGDIQTTAFGASWEL